MFGTRKEREEEEESTTRSNREKRRNDSEEQEESFASFHLLPIFACFVDILFVIFRAESVVTLGSVTNRFLSL